MIKVGRGKGEVAIYAADYYRHQYLGVDVQSVFLSGLERFSAPARAGRGLLGTVRQVLTRSITTLLESIFVSRQQVFLPDGYPHTVSKDYLEYQVMY